MVDQDNILVIKLSALGDFIQALGPMKAIRHHHKDAHITLLTTKPFHSFATESGYADTIIIDVRPKWYDIGAWLKLKKELNQKSYTRVYDLQNNGRVRKYKKLIKQPFDWFSIQTKADRQEHASTRHKKILKRAGIEKVSFDTLDWAGKETDITRLGANPPFALIAPGCDPSRPEKRWPAIFYGEIAQALVQNDIQPVIIGTQAEAKEAQIIQEACPMAINLIDQTSLFDIPALARAAICAVGNDTGPMHIIGPTGCPTLVLFSFASDPAKHSPIGRNIKSLRTQDLEDMPVSMVWSGMEQWIKDSKTS